MHEQAALRAAAGEELKTITKEYFGYYDDLPKRERERAQSRYREWWNSVGRGALQPLVVVARVIAIHPVARMHHSVGIRLTAHRQSSASHDGRFATL